MGEVGVHLEDRLVTRVERPAEAGEVGPPSPSLAGRCSTWTRGFGLRQPVGELAGAVGRVVVHHQDLEPGILLRIAGTICGRFLASL